MKHTNKISATELLIGLICLYALMYLSSCSQKAWMSRGIKKGWVSTDTIVKRDTIHGFDTTVIKQFDTLNHTDTLTIVKNGVKSQTIVKWKDRIVEQTITQRDTVIVTKIAPQINCPSPSWFYNFLPHFLIGLGVGLILTIILKR